MSQQPRLWSPVVRPSGIHRVGDYLRMSWAHMNIGNDALRDVYLDLRVPASLAVIPRETRVGGTARRERSLEDHEREQVALGDVAVGESIWIDVAVRATAPSADTESVAIAVRSGGAEVWTSQDVPVTVRGTAAVTVGDPKVVSQKAEENRFAALYTFANSGTKTATNVVLRVPAPAGFRISRMMLESPTDGVTDNEHDFVRELYFPSVAPEREERVGLEFVATPDALGDAVELAGAVVSFDGGETVVPATSLRLSPHVDFCRSHLALDATSVKAGQILRVRLNVANIGRSDAREVPVAFVLPEELIYASGTLSINGGADARHNDLGNIVLPMVRGRSIAEVAFNASVRAPLEHGTRMAIQARVDEIDVDAVDVDVESHAYFPLSENYVELDEPTSIYADSPRTLIVRMHNAGTDVGEAVRLRLTVSDLSIDRVEIVEGDGRTSNAGVATIGGADVSSLIDIGTIPPGETRRAKVVVRAPEAYPNNTFFEVRGYLRVGEDEELEIGGANLHGCSAPCIDIERSEIRAMRDDEFRIGQMRSVMIRLENTGSADAEDVTVDLDLPATIALRGEDGQLVASHHVGFARVSAWGIAEKTVKLELLAAPEREPTGSIEIHPIVSCPGTSSFRLKPLRLLTTSRAVIDNVRTEIREVEKNEALVTFRATNSGDRAARNMIISLVDNAPAYVAESTTFSATFYDGKIFSLRDCAGTTVLTKGFIVPEFAAGATMALSFKVDLTNLDEFSVGFRIDCDALAPAQPELKRYRKLHQRRALVGDIDDLVLSGPRIVGSSMVPRALQIERTILSARIPVALPGGKDVVAEAPSPIVESREPIADPGFPGEAAETPHDVAEADESRETGHRQVAADGEKTLATHANLSEPADEAETEVQAAVSEETATPVDDDPRACGAASDAVAEITSTTTASELSATRSVVSDEATAASPSTETAADAIASNGIDRAVGPVTITVIPDSAQQAAAPAAMELQGAFGIMQLNEARLRKIAHFLEVLSGKEDELGMYRHLLAMRLFLPDGIHGVSQEDSVAYAGVIQPLAVVKQTKMLAFVATKSFTIAPMMVGAFEGNDVADAALVLHTIADRVSRRSFNVTVNANHGYLVSTFGTSYLTEYRNERPGGGHFHRMLAELLPNISADYPQIGEELATYRKMLVDELDQFVYQAPLPRYESLRRARTANLDAALSRVGRAFGAREYAHD